MVTDQEKKPVLDQQTFERLLEAAHVLQEHNRGMRELEERVESRSAKLREQESANQAPPDRSKAKSEETSHAYSDYTLTLAEIVEAQRQIQMRHLELDKAMAVVAESVARITGASGAAIAILEGSTVRYRAGAGAPALPLGTEVPLEKAVCAASLRTGQVIRSEDVSLEFLFDPETCRPRGIVSLSVVPIYREDEIVGALELYFDKTHGFAEQDIHTCQLMAGLVTEAIARDAEVTLKKSMAAERSSMLAAIERLQPNLAAWAEGQTAASTSPGTGASSAAATKLTCWKCGNKLLAEEQFCGKCGAPQANDAGPSSMQSQLAAASQLLQNGAGASATTFASGAAPDEELMGLVVASKPGSEAGIEEANARYTLSEASSSSLQELEESNSLSAPSFAASATEDAKAQPPSRESHTVWTSAARARDFLESLTASGTPSAIVRFWRSRRGDFYLAVAVILVGAVIRWGIWSSHSVGATGRGTAVSGSTRGRQSAPEPDLSAFDKLLISLGLAEAPEAPEYKGNPDTPVWVDLHTALYYCPGSDLYGKTSQGKLATQRDAQLDQFEPANRKACD
jgi:putative methionine-R-sulfoxide reductase with GAF domain